MLLVGFSRSLTCLSLTVPLLYPCVFARVSSFRLPQRAFNLSIATFSNCKMSPIRMGSDESTFNPSEEELTVFDRIVDGSIPCVKVYEDEHILAFHDIKPVAPVHFLVIPKRHAGLTRLSNATDAHAKILGYMMVKVAEITRSLNIGDYRLVINDGAGAGQQIFHLHMHVIAGRQLSWPPG
ncbi:Histidine triad nucleotide-binding protein 1 (HIT) domain protein [Babesia bovis T2Bo]|uniref:HIT domain containing protein n=1 Tax=Babesia bovis TaxID=5865 RepID=A7AQA5_BABBO|nr:Histidine triad nucleotide-binding protein 1 (HIT) domain protein [Babesia bovis T2Bo]EDO08739.1 Histidine triad nucleotide-binding protein 1 (HIT) domain protein [Babesia bovis T2Bo]|eukprot:XP_001612307.1 HIT domain containing protein [Babesia bovis T2Bo]